MERVTAVMITGKQPERIEFAKAAIRSFNQQVYPDKRLLIVNDGEIPLREVARDLFDDKITEVMHPRPESGNTLGALRNVALDIVGRGNLVIQWDDDDWYHHRRIWDQVHAMTDPDVPVTLAAQIRYSFSLNIAIPVYQMQQPDGTHLGIPGTILYRVSDNRYEHVGKHEDSWFFKRYPRVNVLNNWTNGFHELYIRFEHGFNTWHARHIMGKYADTRRRNTWYIRSDSARYLKKVLAEYYSQVCKPQALSVK